MHGSSSRRRPRWQRPLVAFQVLLLVASLFAAVPVAAADPSPEPSPSVEPSTAPDATAAPSADPSDAPTPDPAATPDPTAEPTSTPDPTPAPPTEPSAGAAPTITSSKDDYAPGELVTLRGANWQPGESVHIFVNDNLGSTWSRQVDLDADSAGNIINVFNLPDWFVAEYLVAASGAVSGTAYTTFTDARTVLSATLNGGATVTVAPSGSITATVSVRTDGSGANARWRSTSWRIATTPPGTITCVNHADHDGPGDYVETLTITAPAAIGTYDAYFQAHADDTCGGAGGGASVLFTLANGVIVANPSVVTSTAVTSNNNPSIFGQSVTFTATVSGSTNPSGVGTVTFKDGTTAICSAVALTGNTAQCATSALTAVASPHSITAEYSGATGFTSSTSAPLSQVVNKKSVTVTPTSGQTKVYGAADPTLTYSLSESVPVTGALARVAGESVGGRAITMGTLATTSGNHVLVLAVSPVSFTISTRPIEVTADPQTKVYGEADPALTYQITSGSLAFSDAFSGGLTRDPGEDVGSYAITQGSLALGTNYDLTYVGDNLTISTRPIEVTADPQTKVYGEADPGLTYQVTSGSLAFSDAFSGGLTRDPGEDVGSYAITQGSLALGTNYDLTYVGDNLTISTRPIEVTADPQTKVYGEADPGLTYQVTSGSLAFSDAFSGGLTRDPGEDVGSYAITQGSLALGTNYDLTYVGANLTITPKGVVITPDAGQTKVYGNADPTLTFSNDAGLGAGDFTGSLDRAAGENVGPYLIGLGSLSAGTNYSLSLAVSPVSFTISTRPIEVTADPQTKVYGEADPALTYQITSGSLAFSDAFSGGLTRDPGEDVGSYAITQGSLALGTNYDLTYVGDNLTISTRPIEVTADPQTKVYGEADPGLTYQITSGSLAFSDAFSGGLTRDPGEDVGSYAITQGSLALGTNYDLTYVGDNLTISTRPIEVTADPQTKVYGEADPGLTYQVTSGSLAFSDAFSGSLTRAAGENVGPHAISRGSLAIDDGNAGDNYDLTYVGANLTITQRPVTVTSDAKSKVFGSPDPTLTYQLTLGTLVFGNTFSGSLTRAAGENVGPHAISQGSLTLGTNYAITFIGANLNILPWTALGTGFYQPVGVLNSTFIAAPGTPPSASTSTIWNTAKGGSTIPLKFNVFAGGVEKTSLSDIIAFTQTKLSSCTAGAFEDPVEVVQTTGSTTLRYDTQWIQNWKTPTANVETCYRATVTFADSSTLSAFFKLKK